VIVSQTMVTTPIVLACMPLKVQGDTEERPRPMPSISNIKESAAAAAEPARIALQEIALALLLDADSKVGSRKVD
jgi:hypothetical protein